MTWLINALTGLAMVSGPVALAVVAVHSAVMRDDRKRVDAWSRGITTRCNQLTERNAYLHECNARLTSIVLQQRERLEALATSPTDRALCKRVAYLELLVMPAIDEQAAESAHEAMWRKTRGGNG
jgi:hypothetical protein